MSHNYHLTIILSGVIVSILRAIAITRPASFPGGGIFLFITMSTVEPAVMIICACLPVMRPLFASILKTVPGYATWRSRYHSQAYPKKSSSHHKSSSTTDEEINLTDRPLPNPHSEPSRQKESPWSRFAKLRGHERGKQDSHPADEGTPPSSWAKVTTLMETVSLPPNTYTANAPLSIPKAAARVPNNHIAQTASVPQRHISTTQKHDAKINGSREASNLGETKQAGLGSVPGGTKLSNVGASKSNDARSEWD